MRFTNEETLIANGRTPQLRKKRADVLAILSAAIDAVDPYTVTTQALQGPMLSEHGIELSSFSKIDVIAFGKASLGMAKAASAALPLRRGVVITPTATPPFSDTLEIVVGGHPLPTQGSVHGAQKALALLQKAAPDDLVLVLISGGGSALFEQPSVPLADLQTLTRMLLASGASIDELNTVRRHLSRVKGGRLVTQTQATIVSLIISDVVHDALESIASGPTAPDPTTFQDAVDMLDTHDLKGKIPRAIEDYLAQGLRGIVPETPKPDNPCFSRVHNLVIANNSRACQAAGRMATSLGYAAEVVSTAVTGEARMVGSALMQNAKRTFTSGRAIITGGETTVHVTGRGVGGRNQELVLSAVQQMAGTPIMFASCATDGIDGSSPAAGALADGYSLQRSQEARLDPGQALRENDSYRFFSLLGDSLLCGLTGTNVMDIQVLL